MTRRQLAWVSFAFVVALSFRAWIAAAYGAGISDGEEYFRLARELRLRHHVSFRRAPAEASYARPPAYPALLSLCCIDGEEDDAVHAHEIRKAAALNAVFDAGTLLGMLLVGVRLGATPGVLVVAMALWAAWPSAFSFASLTLTESLATCVGTLAFAALLGVASSSRPRRWLAGGSVLVGVGLLVRADMVALVPPLVVTAWRSVRARLLGAVSALVALVAGALPLGAWCARNVMLFGEAHPFGAEWMTHVGTPLGAGPIAWMRTWAAGEPEAGMFAGTFVFDRLELAPSTMVPAMASTPEERERVAALLRRLPSERLSPSVDAEFYALASARVRAHPARVLAGLPLLRLRRMLAASSATEYPRPPWLIAHARLASAYDAVVYATFLVGAIALGLVARRRQACALVLLAIGARVGLHLYAVPQFVSKRYLVEIFPLVALLAAHAPWALGVAREALTERRARRSCSG